MCRRHAAERDFEVAPAFEFRDAAISGTTVNRMGLDAMREAARRRDFSVLIVHSLSRLSRETTFVLPLLKELHAVYGVRILSVAEGIDSDREGWYDMAMVYAMMHERYLKELAANVHRGQVGTVVSGFSAGDYVLGYTSVVATDVPLRGRNAKPRRRYAIDEGEAFWVRMIFFWFAREERSISWIADELNRHDAPKDHRSSTPTWYGQLVSSVLKNKKYIGRWPWGRNRNVRNPFTGKVQQQPRSEKETREWKRVFPELRLIDDETFHAAQARLSESAEQMQAHRGPGGLLRGSSGDRQSQHLLAGLIRCGTCGRRFVTVDRARQRLACSGHARKSCPVSTQLRRDVAEPMIIAQLEEKLLRDERFADQAYAACLQAWKRLSETRPESIEQLQGSRIKCQQRIERLVSQIEDEEAPDPSIRSRLEERRRELREIDDRLRELSSSLPLSKFEPSREWVEQELKTRLSSLASQSPAAIRAVQELLSTPIVVQEVEIPHRRRKFLQGRLVLSPTRISALLIGSTDEAVVGDDIEIMLDFRKVTITEDQARRAHALWEDGASCTEIAEQLGVTRSRVTEIFRFADQTLGLPYPKTRLRPRVGDLSARIEGEVIAMWEAGQLIAQIAEALDVCRPTVRTVLKRYHERRGEKMPDGRSRRKNLTVKQRPRDESTSDPIGAVESPEVLPAKEASSTPVKKQAS